ERRLERPDDAEIGQVDRPAERIGHQVDLVAVLDERLDPVVLAERGAARLEERLRGQHQDPERWAWSRHLAAQARTSGRTEPEGREPRVYQRVARGPTAGRRGCRPFGPHGTVSWFTAVCRCRLSVPSSTACPPHPAVPAVSSHTG